jgi:phytoene desaturase
VTKGAKRVIVVGAGLSGLTAALYLSAAGRDVTLVDKRHTPGGRHAGLEFDGYRFDVGPAQAWTPEKLAAPLAAVGEDLADWVDLEPLDPVCRAHYPDGTTLDVHADPYRTADNIRDLCGGPEARAFIRFLSLSWVPGEWVLNDQRTLSLCGSTALFGFAPWTMAWQPRGGFPAVAQAFAAVAHKCGVNLRLATSARLWETLDDRMVAVHTGDGERLTADAFIVPAGRTLVADGPSQLVIHLGTSRAYTKIATHNIHFGRRWQRNVREVLERGQLMRDPTVLVTALDGTYRIVVPVPNLRRAPYDWDGPAARIYAGEIMTVLERRGYLDLGADLHTSYVMTPADWARQDMPYGIPHGSTKSPSTLHPALANVVIAASGVDGGRRAAKRVIAI